VFESKSELSQADVKQARNFTRSRRPTRCERRISNIFSTLPVKGSPTLFAMEDVPPCLASTSHVRNWQAICARRLAWKWKFRPRS